MLPGVLLADIVLRDRLLEFAAWWGLFMPPCALACWLLALVARYFGWGRLVWVWNGDDYVEHFEEPKPLDWLGYGSLVGMAIGTIIGVYSP